ncbi:Signal transduction histidine-protein kinase/phosphatase MprB OS=Tsukamurella paurometabola (strain ATCC 8368 / DSM / CCUG 35730 / CIP 100753 / JCM 10117/ KCTC 9821 / NBRC 16120 / NCIMB 702349 / NCTC 13040) OX=521096 GN=Tpau_2016 PE=4 SV=1 [Tsukamurella paurometabola]|uniref:histidine kinase n=2 Tax=Tsukamurella paurometabola TaxID=2061 RepID=D5UNR0_TSUPD|nr:integral membrane sensor signal transduction histidine kinase [Tsukamurella paurometabola DSM 20162]SUP32484.1 Sensor protein kinase walK [Tsukamurella paurometabola]
MMLDGAALAQIVVTALLVTLAVTVATLGVLRVTPRASIGLRAAVAIAGALLSVVASTLAIAVQMYLSGHDLTVLLWVIATSAVFSVIATPLVVGRAIGASITALRTATRRVGDGDVVEPTRTGLAELDEVSAELAQTSRRLEESRARVAELDAARGQFFAWISHDLRTPLTGIRALAEALDEGTAPDRAAYLTALRGKVDTLNGMITDLFELSTMQSGTLRIHPEPVVLLDLVSDAVADCSPIARRRGITIAQDGIDGHLVLVDPRELTRVVGNLLTNSLRHAPADSEVVVRADPLADGRLVLSVIDQGPGVAAEDLGRMFDVGWRADAARSADDDGGTTGAGLGLAIVRGIVEAHGGSVVARSTEAGFRLDLTLPTAGR